MGSLPVINPEDKDASDEGSEEEARDSENASMHGAEPGSVFTSTEDLQRPDFSQVIAEAVQEIITRYKTEDKLAL
eukprot:CAMPEP_0170452584 /NCGR_PEP_ID=MMETSP0123-20130129/1431_1 /TAXON_ID=182087 /ORGANISM="Favella ehrenbergii, Strain Fehren 1" /LENGTH=74 /DNA_ID=CAMNT_0010714633 /DNA_START=816 /DNA_END=1040 /DNA_ORIENTATION=+